MYTDLKVTPINQTSKKYLNWKGDTRNTCRQTLSTNSDKLKRFIWRPILADISSAGRGFFGCCFCFSAPDWAMIQSGGCIVNGHPWPNGKQTFYDKLTFTPPDACETLLMIRLRILVLIHSITFLRILSTKGTAHKASKFRPNEQDLSSPRSSSPFFGFFIRNCSPGNSICVRPHTWVRQVRTLRSIRRQRHQNVWPLLKLTAQRPSPSLHPLIIGHISWTAA